MAVLPRSPSQSAMLTAAARALHREQSPPWVLDDPFSLGLAGDGGVAMMEQARKRLSSDGLQSFVRWVALRARFTEDLVAQGVDEGIGQYVILGAGLDSFAYRQTRLLQRLRVYEVDHPASQAWKRSRLAELGVTAAPGVVYAPVDFETQTLRDGLLDAGFDFEAPALFSWMGVTMYLTLAAIRGTLNDIATAASGSRLVLTYNQPPEILDDFSREVAGELSAAIGEGGEPFVSVFTEDEARALMHDAGFVHIEDHSPESVQRRYFAEADRIPIAGAQHLLTASLP